MIKAYEKNFCKQWIAESVGKGIKSLSCKSDLWPMTN